MSRQFRRGILAAALAWAAVFILGCSTAERHQWANFFFDGVPPPGGRPAAEESEAAEVERVAGPAGLSMDPLPKIGSSHPPYTEGQCSECHDRSGGQKMKGGMPAACFGCHDDFIASSQFGHSAAVQGECLACHYGHDSPNEKLLIRLGREMCLECHDDPVAKGRRPDEPGVTDFLGPLPKLVKDSGKTFNHAPAEGDCMVCHDPHASNYQGVLHRPTAETCAECHEDPLAGAKFKHDPAANGECMACHAPHAANEAGLLIKGGAALCYECHEESDIQKVEAHKQAGDRGCTSCHDPHGGADENLLKTTARKLLDGKGHRAHAKK